MVDMPQLYQDPDPVCGRCTATMTDRDRNYWFCPSCAEKGRHTGMIHADEPAHPLFGRRLLRDPELAVGMHLVMDDEYDDLVETIGEVVEYDDDPDTYTVVGHDDVLECRVVREISLGRIHELLETPNGPGAINTNGVSLYLE